MIDKKENADKKDQDMRRTLENEDIGSVSYLLIRGL